MKQMKIISFIVLILVFCSITFINSIKKKHLKKLNAESKKFGNKLLSMFNMKAVMRLLLNSKLKADQTNSTSNTSSTTVSQSAEEKLLSDKNLDMTDYDNINLVMDAMVSHYLTVLGSSKTEIDNLLKAHKRTNKSKLLNLIHTIQEGDKQRCYYIVEAMSIFENYKLNLHNNILIADNRKKFRKAAKEYMNAKPKKYVNTEDNCDLKLDESLAPIVKEINKIVDESMVSLADSLKLYLEIKVKFDQQENAQNNAVFKKTDDLNAKWDALFKEWSALKKIIDDANLAVKKLKGGLSVTFSLLSNFEIACLNKSAEDKDGIAGEIKTFTESLTAKKKEITDGKVAITDAVKTQIGKVTSAVDAHKSSYEAAAKAATSSTTTSSGSTTASSGSTTASSGSTTASSGSTTASSGSTTTDGKTARLIPELEA